MMQTLTQSENVRLNPYSNAEVIVCYRSFGSFNNSVQYLQRSFEMANEADYMSISLEALLRESFNGSFI